MALWLYGFAWSLPAAASGLRGVVDGAPPRSVALGTGVVAVVSEVEAEAFSALGTAATLEDLQALQPMILRHAGVQAAVHAAVPFLPTPFGALFSGEEALKDAVSGATGPLAEAVARIGASKEFAVQAWAEAEPEEDPTARPQEGGAAWLRRKQASSRERRQRLEVRRQALEALAAELDAATADATALPPPSMLPEGVDGEILANWALLVPRGTEDDVLARIEAARSTLTEVGVHLRVTGPWAPASFVPEGLEGVGG